MAKLKIVSTGSHGNSFLLICERETLLIELGVSWDNILRSLDYNLDNVVGCLVSHCHKDHSISIPNALKFSLSVYSCKDVQSIYPQVKVLERDFKKRIGGFLIQPIPLYHDVECYGFLIEHKEFGRMLFATDTNTFPYRLKNINHILIEANYKDEYIIDNLCMNEASCSASGNHLEINETIEAIKKNYTQELQNVVLIHLSHTNANSVEFKKDVESAIGMKCVTIGESDVEVELNSCEF